jgi:UDP-glucose 4-epimerase
MTGMPHSLVTGGAGFIGSHVAHHLIQAGHKVVVLDDLSGGFTDHVAEGAEFVNGTILDAPLLSRLFSEHRFDYVYHLAAYAAEGLSHFIKRFNYENNLVGSVNLINESVKHDVKCFVFTSSIAVYGALSPPMREEDTPRPEDPYGIAKLAVEQDLRVTHEMFGLPYVVFRPHNVYGEHQNLGDRYRNVVGIFMNQLMQGRPLTVFGDGLQTRAFSYIGDVAPWIARSPEIPAARNQVFNIGADQEYSIKALAEATMKALGTRGELRHLPARQEVVHAWADHSKARRVFGIESLVSLEEGLGRMAAWATKTGIRKSQRFGKVEIERGLPAVWLED